MTAEQKIKLHILQDAISRCEDVKLLAEVSAETIDEAWEEFSDYDECIDFMNEFRESGEPTGLSAPKSRYYESTEVARQLSDGTWVGWTYWYGGGKHGEPEWVDWIDKAYFVEVSQETRVVNVFKKCEGN